MVRNAPAALALSFLLAALALAPAPAEEPPCTDDTCGTGGTYVNATAVLETNWGKVCFMLYEAGAPITTANFMYLASTQFFDGIKFHRCIDDFVAQTGDPNTKNNNPYDDGWGGSGKTIPLEINDTLTHEDGAVGMARSQEPDSASSQFYICDGPQHGLDGDYAVFGIVVEGLDVAKKIAAAPTYGNKRPLLKDHPVDDIVMERVHVEPGYWVNATNATSPQALGSLSLGMAGGLGLGAAAAAASALGVAWYLRKRGLARERAG